MCDSVVGNIECVLRIKVHGYECAVVKIGGVVPNVSISSDYCAVFVVCALLSAFAHKHTPTVPISIDGIVASVFAYHLDGAYEHPCEDEHEYECECVADKFFHGFSPLPTHEMGLVNFVLGVTSDA